MWHNFPILHAIKHAADNIFDILFNGGHKIQYQLQ